MNTRVILLLLIICTAAFAACKKNNSDAPATNYTTKLNVVNASADTINFYLNGTRLNSNSNLYPDVISGYMNVLAFNQNYQVKKAFNPATGTVQQLFSKPLNLDTAQYYSLFIAGETKDLAFETTDPLSSVTDTGATTCLVRFVNASPDGNKYDLTVSNGPKFTAQAFGTASSFTLADTSSNAVVTLYQSGSTTPLGTGTVSLLQQKIYTIYTKGKLNAKGSSALGLAIMENY
jgi:hypothetical protein